MATQLNMLPEGPVETGRDFEFPQREAAFFYGLFLRGHSADELRRDIQIPAPVLAKWDRETSREPGLRAMPRADRRIPPARSGNLRLAD